MVEDDDITQLFSNVLPDVEIIQVRLIRNQAGAKRGFAFVDVKTREMAESGLKLNNMNLKGMMLLVHISKPPSQDDNCLARTIFV